MRQVVIAAGIFAVVLIGAPSMAHAQSARYGAVLTGSGESPAVVTAAFGDFTMDVDITSGRADFVLRLWNVPAAVTGAHIHLGVGGANGPVIYNLNPPGFSGDVQLRGSINLVSGLSPQPTRGLVDVRDVLQILEAHPEMLYVNVHTTPNPGGEIRGQLQRNP